MRANITKKKKEEEEDKKNDRRRTNTAPVRDVNRSQRRREEHLTRGPNDQRVRKVRREEMSADWPERGRAIFELRDWTHLDGER